jgi:type II secretory ATPase GspE/PulE/Tfp pilus assembly ATPase PilB-like protein
VRVSTLPTLHGESIVLRLLDSESGGAKHQQRGVGRETHEP